MGTTFRLNNNSSRRDATVARVAVLNQSDFRSYATGAIQPPYAAISTETVDSIASSFSPLIQFDELARIIFSWNATVNFTILIFKIFLRNYVHYCWTSRAILHPLFQFRVSFTGIQREVERHLQQV